MAKHIVYGEGGYNPNLPNDNIIEEIEIDDELVTEQELLRQSALKKLTALGLTEDEARAIAGV